MSYNSDNSAHRNATPNFDSSSRAQRRSVAAKTLPLPRPTSPQSPTTHQTSALGSSRCPRAVTRCRRRRWTCSCSPVRRTSSRPVRATSSTINGPTRHSQPYSRRCLTRASTWSSGSGTARMRISTAIILTLFPSTAPART